MLVKFMVACLVHKCFMNVKSSPAIVLDFSFPLSFLPLLLLHLHLQNLLEIIHRENCYYGKGEMSNAHRLQEESKYSGARVEGREERRGGKRDCSKSYSL